MSTGPRPTAIAASSEGPNLKTRGEPDVARDLIGDLRLVVNSAELLLAPVLLDSAVIQLYGCIHADRSP
jgi:hypothetical protein